MIAPDFIGLVEYVTFCTNCGSEGQFQVLSQHLREEKTKISYVSTTSKQFDIVDTKEEEPILTEIPESKISKIFDYEILSCPVCRNSYLRCLEYEIENEDYENKNVIRDDINPNCDLWAKKKLDNIKDINNNFAIEQDIYVLKLFKVVLDIKY